MTDDKCTKSDYGINEGEEVTMELNEELLKKNEELEKEKCPNPKAHEKKKSIFVRDMGLWAIPIFFIAILAIFFGLLALNGIFDESPTVQQILQPTFWEAAGMEAVLAENEALRKENEALMLETTELPKDMQDNSMEVFWIGVTLGMIVITLLVALLEMRRRKYASAPVAGTKTEPEYEDEEEEPLSERIVPPESQRKEDNTYTVTVDYSKSLKQMIKVGNYDYINDNITAKNFPIKGHGKKEVTIKIIHFDKNISSENAITKMKKQGFRPARIEELLTFGATYPEKQRAFPIVALGSVWQFPSGYRSVPALFDWDDDGRSLSLDWFEDDWNDYWRFAFVSEC